MRVIANAVLLGAVAATLPATSFADSLADALANGKVYGDFRLRYEAVSQDNALDDASALTLRSRLGYQTAAYQGFSAQLEFEDSRIAENLVRLLRQLR